MSKKLVLVRHGESLWNNQNKFTGWANIGLTELGRSQAINSGKILVKKSIGTVLNVYVSASNQST